MSLKVFTPQDVIEHRKASMGAAIVAVFDGNRNVNLQAVGRSAVMSRIASKEDMEKPASVRMMELEALRLKVTNQANPPTKEVLEEFFGKFFIDVQRKANEAPDLTPFIAREVTNFDMPETPTLRDLLPFRGQMLQVSGGNDPVPLIEQNTGNVDTLTIKAWAIGWKDSLKNLLFNQFMTMDKVVQAAVDAYTDNRNKLTVGVIVGAAYVASQQQAADTTSGATLDEKTYKTFVSAIKKLRGLKDPQTSRKIVSSRLVILCNSNDTWQIQRVVNGQLEANGGGARGNIVSALPITSLIEYDQGINDGFTVGKTTMSFPGVTAGKCYIFVPNIAIVANKRPLSMESSLGTALQLSTEERAWYHCQGEYFKDFLGSSYAGTSLAAGFGFVVEVTLPTS